MDENNVYVCNCGCSLKFESYMPGLDIYIGNKWIITADRLVDYSWSGYVPTYYKTWSALKEFIIQKHNEALQREGDDNYKPYIHLYNKNVKLYENKIDPIPLNETIYHECAF